MDGTWKNRDTLICVGIASVAMARWGYKKQLIHPFRIGVVIAWPAFGVALMESLTEWRTPIVENYSSVPEAAVVGKAQNAMMLEHLKRVAAEQQSR